MNKPQSLSQLFAFYYQTFKPIYARISSHNTPPVEMLFEVNAAFDHLSRHWQYGEGEASTVHAAAAHLKRGTFDAFKLILKETRDHYDHLKSIDTSIIDNGHFDSGMHALWHRIEETAIGARNREGDSREMTAWDEAFDLWQQAFVLCQEFDEKYYRSPNVPWAKKKWARRHVQDLGLSFVMGVATGLVSSYLFVIYYTAW